MGLLFITMRFDELSGFVGNSIIESAVGNGCFNSIYGQFLVKMFIN